MGYANIFLHERPITKRKSISANPSKLLNVEKFELPTRFQQFGDCQIYQEPHVTTIIIFQR